MSNEIVKINETDLQLVVNEQSIGVLKTNALQLKEMVEQMLPKYDVSNYSVDDVKTAKEDKSKLNKFAKAINDKRIEIERQWMSPFDDFKTTVKEIVDLVKTCSSRIDSVVKEVENKEKEEKKAQVLEILERLKVSEVIDIDKIWDDKWLNKTTSLKSVEKAVTDVLSSITNDIATLSTLYPDHADAVILHYKGCLSLNEAIEWGKELQKASKPKEEVVETKIEEPQVPQKEDNDVDDAFASIFGEEEEQKEEEPVKTDNGKSDYTLNVCLTDAQKTALERYLTINNIEYTWK